MLGLGWPAAPSDAAARPVVAFTDPRGDATTSPVSASPYGGGALDIVAVRLEAARRSLRVSVTTSSQPAVEEFAGYDVTMRAVRRCPGTVFADGFPVEVRFRSGARGVGQATFRGCGAQVTVPVTVGTASLSAAVPLSALPQLRGVVLDKIAAQSGLTDSPYDGLLRLSVDTASTPRGMRLP